jgi:hypothetical protein
VGFTRAWESHDIWIVANDDECLAHHSAFLEKVIRNPIAAWERFNDSVVCIKILIIVIIIQIVLIFHWQGRRKPGLSKGVEIRLRPEYGAEITVG